MIYEGATTFYIHAADNSISWKTTAKESEEAQEKVLYIQMRNEATRFLKMKKLIYIILAVLLLALIFREQLLNAARYIVNDVLNQRKIY